MVDTGRGSDSTASPSTMLTRPHLTMDTRIARNAAAISNITQGILVKTRYFQNLQTMLEEARTKPANQAADEAKLEISALENVGDQILATLRRLQRRLEGAWKIKRRLEQQKRLEQELERGLEFNRLLEELPPELRLHVMRHTHVENINNFRTSGLWETFDENPTAVFRGMEVEQYSESSWLFGNIAGRSPEQKQAFKDFIATFLSLKSRAMFEVFQLVDNDKFSGRSNLWVLQTIRQNVDVLANYAGVTRRTALCLASFNTCRVIFRTAAEKSDQTSGQNSAPAKRMLHCDIKAVDIDDWLLFFQAQPEPAQTLDWEVLRIPLGERIALYEEQSAATQSEIRQFFQKFVSMSIKYFDQLPEPYKSLDRYFQFFGTNTADWIKYYYSPAKTGKQKEPWLMRAWIANLVVGFVLEVALRVPGWDFRKIAGAILYQPPDSDIDFGAALGMEFLNSDSTDDFWEEGREFAQLLNFDLDCVLEGTEVGSCLQSLEAGEPI